MIESIGTQLYTLLSGIVTLNLNEAETESYPYAVYNAPVVPVRSKDGVIKYTTQAVITIYAKDFGTANTKADLIITALEANMRSAQYAATLTSNISSRVEGIWAIELTYTINQYS